jgi:hypothetical protein
MKTKFTSLFFIVPVILFLTACVSNETANSDTVKQTEIYQGYSVTYEAGDMELSATAFFRFGGSAGTTLNLVKPSNVTFNGQEMAMGKNIFSGTFYETNLQTEASKTNTFIFTDTENKTYTNSVSIDPIEISEYPATINKREGFTVSWTGSPVQNGERVYISLEGKDLTNCSSSTDMVGSTSIEIKPELLKDVKPGEANITLKREISSSLSEATHLGGNITITYVAKKVAAKIE